MKLSSDKRHPKENAGKSALREADKNLDEASFLTMA
jgi:hypothetical protein